MLNRKNYYSSSSMMEKNNKFRNDRSEIETHKKNPKVKGTKKPKPNSFQQQSFFSQNYRLFRYPLQKSMNEIFQRFFNRRKKSNKPSASLSELRKRYAQEKIPIFFTQIYRFFPLKQNLKRECLMCLLLYNTISFHCMIFYQDQSIGNHYVFSLYHFYSGTNEVELIFQPIF